MLKLAIITPLFLVLLVIIGYAGMRSYINGDGFSKKVGTTLGLVLGGEGELKKVSWKGWDASSSRYELKNGKGVVKSLEAQDIDAQLRIGSVNEKAWDVTHVEAMKVKLFLGSKDADYVSYEAEGPTGLAALLPSKTKLNTFEVKNLEGKYATGDGPITFKDLRVKGEALSSKKYEADIYDGELVFPWDVLGTVKHLDSKLNYQPDRLEFNEVRLRALDNNRLDVKAVFDLKARKNEISGKLHDVDIARFLDSDWLQSAEGRATATFLLKQDRARKTEETTGHLVVKKGVLSTLPLLEKIATYTTSDGYRRIDLTQCECDYKYVKGNISLTNINIHSEGKGRIKGKVFIDADRSVSGCIQVGIPKGTLSFVPGAETKVFLPGPHGMIWADVHLGGTLDDIRESLTGQLLTGAASGIIDLIPGVRRGNPLTSPQSKQGDTPAKKVVDAGLGLLGGILGGNEALKKSNDFWTFKAHRRQMQVEKKWTARDTWGEGIATPFASIDDKEGKVLARAYISHHKLSARQQMEAWKKVAKGDVSRSVEFLTEEGAASFKAHAVELKQRSPYGVGQSEVVTVIQLSEGECMMLRLCSTPQDVELLKKSLEAMAMSVQKPKVKKDSLIPELPANPGGLLPIPNPFGL